MTVFKHRCRGKWSANCPGCAFEAGARELYDIKASTRQTIADLKEANRKLSRADYIATAVDGSAVDPVIHHSCEMLPVFRVVARHEPDKRRHVIVSTGRVSGLRQEHLGVTYYASDDLVALSDDVIQAVFQEACKRFCDALRLERTK